MEKLTTIMYVFLGLDVLSIGIMFLLKNLSSNKLVFNAIGLYMFVLCVLLFSVVPSSNIVFKLVSAALFVPGVIAFVMKDKDFGKARILMTITIIGSTVGLFMIR